jgi:hypothetical protein
LPFLTLKMRAECLPPSEHRSPVASSDIALLSRMVDFGSKEVGFTFLDILHPAYIGMSFSFFLLVSLVNFRYVSLDNIP